MTSSGFQSDLDTTERRIGVLESQIGGQADLASQITGLQEAILPLAEDRLLLVELRKDTPDNLEDANGVLGAREGARGGL